MRNTDGADTAFVIDSVTDVISINDKNRCAAILFM